MRLPQAEDHQPPQTAHPAGRPTPRWQRAKCHCMVLETGVEVAAVPPRQPPAGQSARGTVRTEAETGVEEEVADPRMRPMVAG